MRDEGKDARPDEEMTSVGAYVQTGEEPRTPRRRWSQQQSKHHSFILSRLVRSFLGTLDLRFQRRLLIGRSSRVPLGSSPRCSRLQGRLLGALIFVLPPVASPVNS